MTRDMLTLLLGEQIAGRLERASGRKLSFTYDDVWRNSADAYPLSLSMPLTSAAQSDAKVRPFLWGVLPENPLVLDRWAKQFQVAASDVFGLIAHIGEDCPGAVRFVRPDRLAALLSARAPKVAWLAESDIEERLGTLRADQAAWRKPTDTGQFSLAGAQPKTALLYDGKRFGIPSGRTPTTHILKPPLPGLDGHAENEHLCLSLARALGMPAAGSEVRRFGAEVAIVVERYDRLRQRRSFTRVHQEDLCQALGVLPSSKYQSDGGPTPAQVIEVLRTHSARADADIATFVDALIFNWLIAGTDAHAKNYSLLLAAGTQVRLAPLYDVASVLPYDATNTRKLKLAMKVGSTYRVHDIDRRNWQQLAKACDLDDTAIIDRARALASQVPDTLADVCADAQRDGLEHAVVKRLPDAVAAHCKRSARRLA